MAHNAHWAALIDTATSETGLRSSQVVLKEMVVLYGPDIRAFAPQSEVSQPIQPADLLKITWKTNKVLGKGIE